MSLFLIRHGQSTNNALTDFSQRVADPPLTDIGELQAQALADYMGKHPDEYGITRLYASPMLRALQTASPLAKALNLPVRVWADICEYGGVYLDNEGIPTGEGFPGLTRPQIMERFPFAEPDDAITDAGWWDLSLGRETLPHVVMRVMKVIGVLEEFAATDERIALVTHGLFIDYLIKAILNQLPSHHDQLFYAQHNTAVNYFIIEEQRGDYYTDRFVGYLNNRAHLSHELWTS
jgi:broad specificity phosphatase PhoE